MYCKFFIFIFQIYLNIFFGKYNFDFIFFGIFFRKCKFDKKKIIHNQLIW